MDSLTAFPVQAYDKGEGLQALWTPVRHSINLGSRITQDSEYYISQIVHQAFALLIWANTGEETVSFVTGTDILNVIKDLAVDSYEITRPNGPESNPSWLVEQRQHTAINTVVSGGSIVLRTTCVDSNEKSSHELVESMALERTPLRVLWSLDLHTSCIDVVAWFDQHCLSAFHVERYFQQLVSFATSFTQPDGLDGLQVPLEVTPEDRVFIQTWNGKPQKLINRCIHDCVTDLAMVDSTKIAIDAWDGRMNRGELEVATNSLATLLVQSAVQVRGVVAILLDKSIWGIVGMLAACKAGAGFVLLDPSLPTERLKVMARQLRTTHAITTKNYMALACELVSTIITHSEEGDFSIVNTGGTSIRNPAPGRLPRVDPADPAFYIFTSGSSGIPKAIVTPHRAWVTTCVECHKYGINESTRVFQYASCSFVVAVLDIIPTLIAGGTVIIPSSEERLNDLSSAIQRLRPSYVCMTPSVAKLLEPSEVPSIKTLVLVGEPIPESLAKRWLEHGNAALLNGYGQSEACSMNSTAVLKDSKSSRRSIGCSSWLNYWIVDPGDHDRLTPVGGIGELVVEGFSIAQGYLGEPEKTAAAFIEAPAWAKSFGAGLDGRKWYKTGDLVQYQQNGDVILFGRKDSQMKINGQRVETADIESHIASAFREEVEQVVVDQVGTEQSRRLVAFLKLRSREAHCTASELRGEVHARLKPLVPAYMVPNHVVLLSTVPRTATGKLDRRALRQNHADDIETSQNLEKTTTASDGLNERSETVSTLMSLCSQVLRVEENRVSSLSNWMTLGGDSLSAITLVKKARDAGIGLTTADLMVGKTLTELCSSAAKAASAAHAVNDLALSPKTDIPLTDFQAHYMAHGSDRGYLYKYVVSFRGSFDDARLQDAVYLWFEKLEALRLSFKRNGSGQPVQSVIEPGQTTWRSRIVLRPDDQTSDVVSSQQDFFANPVLVVLHTSNGVASSCKELSLYINHCIFDGTSVNHMFQDLITCYTASRVSPRPSFLRYLQGRLLQRDETSLLYWKELLRGSSPTLLRTERESVQRGADDLAIETVSRVVYLNSMQPAIASMSVLVYAAWSLVLSVLAGRSDVMFLYLVHGRDEEVEGSDAIIGCCVSEIPCRVRFQDSMLLADVVRSIQAQVLHSVPHAHLGSKTIATTCTDWPDKHRRYDHSSLIVHQNVRIEENLAVGNLGYMHARQGEPEHQMTYDFDLLTTSSSANELSFTISCLRKIYSEAELHAVAEAFLLVIRVLSQAEQTVADATRCIRDIQDLPVMKV